MKKPEVYLDMDGVLADFFHEYAKLAGVPPDKFGHHSYRSIPPAKRDPTLDKMVGTDFFYRLPKFSSTDQLVMMIVKLFGHYHICSSPLRGDHEGSKKWKELWIKENLDPQPVDIIITANKAKWAKQSDGTPNILIDDRGSNISAWENAGGVGIKYQADEDGLSVIVDGIARARKIIKGEQKHVPQELTSLDRASGKVIAKSGDSDENNENHEINDPMQRNAIMARESASAGATGAGNVASVPATGGGWLFGGTVGAPKGKRRKTKIIKR